MEQTNDDRAGKAMGALDGGGYTEAVDLLSDLMHLCDLEGEDFGQLLGSARMHYLSEIDLKDDISPGKRLGTDHQEEPVGEIVIDSSDSDGDFRNIEIPGLSGLKCVVKTYISEENAKENEEFDGTVAPRNQHGEPYILTDVTLGGYGRYKREQPSALDRKLMGDDADRAASIAPPTKEDD